MRKEITMTLILMLALVAVSVCLRQIFVRQANDFLSYSYIAALLAVGTFLLGLFAIVVKRLLVRNF